MKSILKIAAFSAGFFAGGILAGMLFSPKSGKENRDLIASKSRETGKMVKDKATEKAERIKDTVPDLYKATENLNFKDEDLL